MTTRWSPDSCDCIIEYDADSVWVNSVQRCKEPSHKNAIGAAHLAVVLAHNQGYNQKYGSNDPPANWQNELDIRGMGVNERVLAISLDRTDVIDWLDKQDDISNSKRTEKKRIRDL